MNDAEEDEDEMADFIASGSSSLEGADGRRARKAAEQQEKERIQRQKDTELRAARERQQAEDARFNALFQKKTRPLPDDGRTLLSPAGSPVKGKGRGEHPQTQA